MNSIHAIIFDIGNVLLTFQPRDFMQKLLNDPEKGHALYTFLIQSPEWRELDAGRISLADAITQFKRRNPSMREAIDLFFAHWLEMFHPIPETVQLLDRLKEKGYFLYVLSNFIRESYEALFPMMTFLHKFDGIVFSYAIQMAKPDAEIYQHLLHRFHRSAQECLFIDDMENNIQGAQSVGIQTILFQSPEQLSTRFQELGIL